MRFALTQVRDVPDSAHRPLSAAEDRASSTMCAMDIATGCCAQEKQVRPWLLARASSSGPGLRALRTLTSCRNGASAYRGQCGERRSQSVQFWSVLIAPGLGHRQWLALAGLAEVKPWGRHVTVFRLMLLGVLFLDTRRIRAIPLGMVAVLVSLMLSRWLSGSPDARQALGPPKRPLACGAAKQCRSRRRARRPGSGRGRRAWS